MPVSFWKYAENYDFTVPENMGLACAHSCSLSRFKGLNVIVVYADKESVIILVSLFRWQKQLGCAQQFQ